MSSNRFKQAMLNGHQKESITDITTAGIQKTAEKPTPLKYEDTDAEDIDILSPQKAEVSNYSNDYIAGKISDRAADIEFFASQTQAAEPPAEVHQPALPVMQPQYQEYSSSYSESASIKSAKNGKKSVPNMFTQKNESKSIRKSLVLRPSSVKIAENYCSKNGGSFNELIQILLDNFIDEYGL